MLHHKKGRTLGRKKGQRVALLRSLARSLVLQEGIVTTVAKAKELRPFVERLITTGKLNTIASQRLLSSRMGGAPDVVKKISSTLRERFADRKGGYTRVILLGKVGKQATESARIELV